jgi:hypothetical protein
MFLPPLVTSYFLAPIHHVKKSQIIIIMIIIIIIMCDVTSLPVENTNSMLHGEN